MSSQDTLTHLFENEMNCRKQQELLYYNFKNDLQYSDKIFTMLLESAKNGSKEQLLETFRVFSKQGILIAPVDFRELAKAMLNEIKMRDNASDMIIAFLNGCRILLEKDYELKIIVNSNLFLNGYWFPVHNHPLWFYFAVFTLGKTIENHSWVPDDERCRKDPILYDYFMTFPNKWHIYWLMGWYILKSADFSRDEIVKYVNMSFAV